MTKKETEELLKDLKLANGLAKYAMRGLEKKTRHIGKGELVMVDLSVIYLGKALRRLKKVVKIRNRK